MQLHTKVKVKKQSGSLINYDSKIVLIGSCFSESIGEKINYYKFQNTINPFGVLFHPKAIETLVVNAASKKKYKTDSIFFNNERWHCYESHSKLSRINKLELLTVLNENISKLNKEILEASHVIVTLGTAWVYRLIENNTIVANCHKVQQNAFKKELLPIKDIIESLKKIVHAIKSKNPKAVIVFTVSPVRHVKDGFIENTQSKAHLISAIHDFLNKNTRDQRFDVHYFPSYEIMMDELRDYRFYDQDMLHPNKTAIDYIWNCFKTCWISESVFEIMQDVEVVQKGLSHIPFNPNSKQYISFIKGLKEKQKVLNKKLARLVFE